MTNSKPEDSSARMERALLSLDGLSVGDAFGERFFLPARAAMEMVARRQTVPPPWNYTDDTEMALGIVQVLEAHGRIDQDALAQVFGVRYRDNRYRGYGGTAHDILEALHQGEPWRKVSAQVFGGEGSKGNGGAMRVAPLGAYFADDLNRVVSEARASAEVTHFHPEGQAGAISIAVAAAWAAQWPKTREPSSRLFELVLEHTPRGATRRGVEKARALPLETSPVAAAKALGSGERVISEDTVPFSVWCAARHLENYEEALWATVSGLGDRDTTCAIVGGIVALSAGRASIPTAWFEARERLKLRA
ncbi:ADP-ribosylglycohydrolase family protein [Hyalangium rubrum]|uniref:ADP-ribosylglycohydrolase family protein n=1 Tax=Hyalangium rubrum TaxID=3103134 RepID=A0ABU5GX74_9BACT|nr:ADP-ribosylglycohydrolase family protein [Hyalangium sp. s54d21]MDY7225459.1 ADP-ribosylglycohydrolase family protein [Hyalangium sp. s54d21]